ncbi:MAG: glycerol-3-phosphate 1-O-acyltransferase PlsY [Candidatus Binatia bacterium]|nr:glycerol-3-phosphate 1-O-acyltransferase PlsY [Candidatus Binatia bacterium]
MTWELVAVGVAAYLLGSIPSGYLLGLLYRVDVREEGSGNIGATNVARSVGAYAGAVTLGIDAVKGAVPVLLVAGLESLAGGGPAHVLRARVVAAIFAALGHVFSVFLRFRGGKGVATTLGALLALAPTVALGSVAVFAAVLGATRIVSVASIAAALAAPLCAVALGEPGLVIAAAAGLSVLIVARHGENLARLRAGAEPRLGSGQKN